MAKKTATKHPVSASEQRLNAATNAVEELVKAGAPYEMVQAAVTELNAATKPEEDAIGVIVGGRGAGKPETVELKRRMDALDRSSVVRRDSMVYLEAHSDHFPGRLSLSFLQGEPPAKSDLATVRDFLAQTQTYIAISELARDAARRLEAMGYVGADGIVDEGEDARDPELVASYLKLFLAAAGQADAWEWGFRRVDLLMTLAEIKKAGIGDENYALVRSFEKLARAAYPELVRRLDAAAALGRADRALNRPELEAEGLKLVARIVADRAELVAAS